eukprot:gnl/TRDRNA2_/TRDRNA2_178283_c0_seq1.p1 gnl/TRDRNA2_/TRDRNA2_178283_c0~~gnl/TRDRNA2_/TRDRNA2_178283_c0_seq1.p1  ORF type:complete len:226 (+),score=53.01 gnl/TRDRNA2_/TRDRNA2_178283_c0_seq1:98-775(+)
MAAIAQNEVMQVKRLRDSAKLPVRGSTDAAGFDLAAADPAVVPAGGKAIVKTGLSIAIPEGTYARIAPRSGLAAKKMIDCGAGVVDFDYRGEVGVVLFNHGPEDFVVEVGDRVAQLILERISMAPCVEVDSLDATVRGAGGFGSTGVAESVPETPESKKRNLDMCGSSAKTEPALGTAEAEVAALRSELASMRAQLHDVGGLRASIEDLKRQLATRASSEMQGGA